jgi:hypothetical protein
MNRSRTFKALAVAAVLPLLYLADGSVPDAAHGLTIVGEAQAVVGAPLTPVSVAGVARRTTRRVVVAETAAVEAAAATTAANTAAVSQQQAAVAKQQAATAQQQAATAQQQAAAARPQGAPAVGTVVSALPAGCVPEDKGGIEYQKCGGVYYRSAFQGNNLVYVVQAP